MVYAPQEFIKYRFKKKKKKANVHKQLFLTLRWLPYHHIVRLDVGIRIGKQTQKKEKKEKEKKQTNNKIILNQQSYIDNNTKEIIFLANIKLKPLETIISNYCVSIWLWQIPQVKLFEKLFLFYRKWKQTYEIIKVCYVIEKLKNFFCTIFGFKSQT